MPEGAVDVSIDGEWSFAQTLRHLAFAADTWLSKAETRPAAWWPEQQVSVLHCLHVIFDEEWQHLRFALRDLDAQS